MTTPSYSESSTEAREKARVTSVGLSAFGGAKVRRGESVNAPIAAASHVITVVVADVLTVSEMPVASRRTPVIGMVSIADAGIESWRSASAVRRPDARTWIKISN